MSNAKRWTIGLVLWGVIGVGLMAYLEYPSAYGISCRSGGRYGGGGCIAESGVLLDYGGPLELLLFAWLWSLPVMIVAILVYGGVAQLRNRGKRP